MAQGLAVSRLINVILDLTPLPAQFQNFDTCMIMGDSDVINVSDRYRSYNDLASVALDFGTTAPEYLAATLFFSQTPQPTQLYIGRWAQSATHGLLICGPLTSDQQAINIWAAITDGSFTIPIDNAFGINITGLSFAGQTNLNGVAGVISAALTGHGATCTWDGASFEIKSATTGINSLIGPLTAEGAGTDLSLLMRGTVATLEEEVPGIAAETALAAVIILDTLRVQWYALTPASTHIVDADIISIAGYIEGSGNPHIFGVTSSEAAAITPNDTSSLGYQLQQLSYRRTFVQYSETNPYAVTSLIARGCTVNFGGNLTVITFMWKQEPGVVAEGLTSSEADALDSTNQNYFASYNNGTAIVARGTVADGDFIDNTWDLDWLVNQIQTNVYNLLYTNNTKVPQTDGGNNQIRAAISAACDAGVNNGTLAPGQWNEAGFGQLQRGDNLAKGYYVYQPPIATQAESDRAARKSVPFQVAVKLAGAIHTVSITVNVDR